MSRTKDDPARCKRYFLQGYSLVVALTLPLTAICALFAPGHCRSKDHAQGSQKDAVFFGERRAAAGRINLLETARDFGVVERV